MSTVLLSVVAATITGVVLTQVLRSAKSESNRTAIDAAHVAAEDALRQVEVSLAADPYGFLEGELPGEPMRVACPSGPTAWDPAVDGTAWCYATGSPAGNESNSVHLHAPSSADPHLKVTAVGVSGDWDVALERSYRMDGADLFTVWTGGDLALDDLSRVNFSNSATTELAGSVYAAGNLFAPTAAGVSLSDLQIVAAGSTDVVPAADVVVYDANPATANLDVSDLTGSSLSLGDLRASAARVSGIACAAPTALCLTAGTTYGSVTAPSSVDEWLITFSASTGAEIEVFYRQDGGEFAGDCLIRCDVTQLATAQVTAGEHPAVGSYWTPLGTFPVPSSGLVWADADVHLGLCGSAFIVEGSTCTPSAVPAFLTIGAGTAVAPADVFIGSTITADDAALGVVATGSVVFPYWAAAPGTTTTHRVEATIVALGYGVSAADDVASIRTLPESVAAPLPGSATEGTVAGSLELVGTLAGSGVDASLRLYRDVTIQPRPDSQPAAPWLPGFGGTWSVVSTDRVFS
ncbi:MAG: hypothetical protein GY901_07285 [Actinomycetia bacterium]|nr:hypothetical protein [Actinomycetes bacterium]